MDERENNNLQAEEKSVDEILKELHESGFQAESIEDEKPIEETGISMKKSDLNLKKAGGKKRKKRGYITVIIWVAVILAISVGITGLFWMVGTDVMGISRSDREIAVTIPKGATTSQIADILTEEGAIQYPFLFRVYSRLNKADGSYQYGTYYVKASAGYEGIVDTLQQVGSFAQEVQVRLKEGTTVDSIAKLLQKNGVCTESEFRQAVNSADYSYDFIGEIPNEKVYYLLEGYLFPDTYMFFKSEEDNGVESAERAINKMLSQLDENWTDSMQAKADKMGYSMHEVLTLASIVEMEASGYYDEMPKVAKVFLNRLDNWENPLLGSTPTAKYPHGSGRYDTNEYAGLPPGPLCSPSREAINAVLNPDKKVKATYFVTDKNKKFYFTNSLGEHEAIISSLKNQGLWEY